MSAKDGAAGAAGDSRAEAPGTQLIDQAAVVAGVFPASDLLKRYPKMVQRAVDLRSTATWWTPAASRDRTARSS